MKGKYNWSLWLSNLLPPLLVLVLVLADFELRLNPFRTMWQLARSHSGPSLGTRTQLT